MFDKHTVELDWGGRKLTLETGKVARQADGAVVATYGDTTVLATVVAAKTPPRRRRFSAADRRLPGKVSMRPAAFPAAISSVKAVRPKRRRWSAA